MKESEDEFVQRRSATWHALESLTTKGRPWHRLAGPALSDAAAMYRSVASDLMQAEAAGYTMELVHYLDALAGRAHSALYAAPPYRLGAITDLLWRGFPRTLRKHRRAFFVAAALFVFPFIAGFVGGSQSRRFALQVLSEEQAEEVEAMYSQAPEVGRTQGVNAQMAGFYVQHNIGLAFQCFATGILIGIGSAFFLLINGLQLGTVVGVVTAAGYGRNLFPFVSGHGAFELTAIVIAGTAGLVMGYALIDTKGLKRSHSLRQQAPDLARLIVGAAIFLAVAAGLEGFWSPSGVPVPIKFAAAAVFWVSVAGYLVFAGRRR